MAILTPVPDTKLMQELVSRAPNANNLLSEAIRAGINPEDLVKALDKAAFDAMTPQIVSTKLFDTIPIGAKLVSADKVSSGAMHRASQELADVIARKARNNKIMAGTGLAALLATGLYAAFSDKVEDKYKRDVEALMDSAQVLSR